MREFEFCPALRRSSSSEQDEDEELLESLPKSLLPCGAVIDTLIWCPRVA